MAFVSFRVNTATNTTEPDDIGWIYIVSLLLTSIIFKAQEPTCLPRIWPATVGHERWRRQVSETHKELTWLALPGGWVQVTIKARERRTVSSSCAQWDVNEVAPWHWGSRALYSTLGSFLSSWVYPAPGFRYRWLHFYLSLWSRLCWWELTLDRVVIGLDNNRSKGWSAGAVYICRTPHGIGRYSSYPETLCILNSQSLTTISSLAFYETIPLLVLYFLR